MSYDAVYSPEFARYSRQMLFPPIGVEGQRRLKHASVTLVGCGALGSVLASTLVRAGVGALRLIDRDFIELNNLQRQILFDEHDIAQNLPKAEAAARKLRKINSAVEVEAVVADVNPDNVVALCGEADLLLDGTDNLETRYLINDVAVLHDIPWVYGACIAAEGLVLPIVPHRTPCLRCIWEEPPAPGVTPTCETAGVLASAVNIVASLQAVEAIKILIGSSGRLLGAERSGRPPGRPADAEGVPTAGTEPGRDTGLLAVDAWAGRIRSVNVQPAFDEGNCPCCKQGRYDFLAGGKVATTSTLCGRDAVQIRPPSPTEDRPPVSFRTIASRLPAYCHPKYNEFMLKFVVEAPAGGGAAERGGITVTLFHDGRAIVQGTSDPTIARGIYAKYVGM